MKAKKPTQATPAASTTPQPPTAASCGLRKTPQADKTLWRKFTLNAPLKSSSAAPAKSPTPKPWWRADHKKANPAKYDPLFKQAESLAVAGRKAIEAGDLKKVGDLMNENHRILQEIGVSSKELDLLVDMARKQGAFGAKLTGGGGGGCMVALTPGKDLQGKVASAFKTAGYEFIATKISVVTY